MEGFSMKIYSIFIKPAFSKLIAGFFVFAVLFFTAVKEVPAVEGPRMLQLKIADQGQRVREKVKVRRPLNFLKVSKNRGKKKGKKYNPTPTPETTSSPTPEPTAVPTPEPVLPPVSGATPTPTPEPVLPPVSGATPTPTPEPVLPPVPEATPTPTQTPEPVATLTAIPTIAPPVPPDGGSTIGDKPWTIKNSIVHYDNRAVFPLGFYYVTYGSSQKPQRLEDIKKIAQAGFNFIHTPIDRNDRELFDKCAVEGVNIVMEFNDTPSEMLELFGGHPALAFIGAFDDVDAYDNGLPRYSPEEVLSDCRDYKQILPDKLVYISGGYPARSPNYAGTSEVMGFQCYPIPAEPLSATTTGYYGPMESVMADYNQAFIGNLQSFGWYGTYRWPTNRELRSMTYQALITGIKGILYYTFYDGQNNLNEKPEFWNELTDIAGEIHAIEDFLLHGLRVHVATGDTRTFAAFWQLEDELIVVAANARQDRSVQVSLELPYNLLEPAVNMFSYRESGLKLDGNRLSGSLAPEDVHVYRIQIN
jgi:hypothetical protein